ncbi:MAG: UDP-N-acetylmuramoyl-tripeptide--D-alanyl-D-alanine ligase [Gammaproteobacteria bacterium]|nr:MAG: UDP-N-acetylmuramoyl-tripeptide--D-alanyl-D-alanine ligase [Gammaproteobacteria bacterium]
MSMFFTLDEVVEILGAELVGGDAEIADISIDSRSLAAGDLYVAIEGERFDGHDFVDAAEAAGAAAVLVSRRVSTELPQLVVADTRVALGALARWWAKQFMVPTVAITGSNGKTTLKELVASILGQLGPVLATEGNLNNDIGVPLTLFRLRPEHRYAVIELGANHAGEIARLVSIVEPDVAIVNNVGRAHLEGFGSLDAVAEAKSEIFSGLGDDGFAVINADDAYADVMRKAASHATIREFGLDEQADVRGLPGPGLQIDMMGAILKPRFALAGDHNGMNALAAVAAALCLHVQPETIVAGLEAVKAVPGRLQYKIGVNHSLIIDDSYNANPPSVMAAIDVLAANDGERHLVLGDMAELGDDAEDIHGEVGRYARERGIDAIWTVGALAGEADCAFADTRAPRLRQRDARGAFESDLSEGGHFADQPSLSAALRQVLDVDSVVMVKGSRSAHMERVVEALVVNDAGNEETPEMPEMPETPETSDEVSS